MESFVIVGLGNPGKEYAQTRHNAGWLALDAAADLWEATFKPEKRWQADVGSAKVENKQIHLVKPTTFMNLSGQAVRGVLDYYKVPASHLLVVTDDIDLPFGTIRTRLEGSSGGHNGLKSLFEHVGTEQLARLRIGVQNEHRARNDAKDFVLDRFSTAELAHLPNVLTETTRLIEAFVNGDFADDTFKTLL